VFRDTCSEITFSGSSRGWGRQSPALMGIHGPLAALRLSLSPLSLMLAQMRLDGRPLSVIHRGNVSVSSPDFIT
jgi:hypothetical protein